MRLRVNIEGPAGRAFLCLDALREGETKEICMGDPTHEHPAGPLLDGKTAKTGLAV
jgi:hypothetical protein